MSSTDGCASDFLPVQFNGRNGTFPATVFLPLKNVDELIIKALEESFKFKISCDNSLKRTNASDIMIDVIFSSEYAKARRIEFLTTNNIISASEEENLTIGASMLWQVLGGDGSVINCHKTEYIVV